MLSRTVCHRFQVNRRAELELELELELEQGCLFIMVDNLMRKYLVTLAADNGAHSQVSMTP